MKKGFSRPNKIRLNGMASDIFKVISNFLRNEKRIQQGVVIINFNEIFQRDINLK